MHVSMCGGQSRGISSRARRRALAAERYPDYRRRVLKRLPQLTKLDFSIVTLKEREHVECLAIGGGPAVPESDPAS